MFQRLICWFKRWITSPAVMLPELSSVSWILDKNVWTFRFEGLIRILPLGKRRTVCPKKSKPFSIGVILVFSWESSSPRCCKKCSTRGWTSFFRRASDVPVIMSRVARGNFTPRPSRNRTGASRLIRLLSPGQGRLSPPSSSPSLGCPDEMTEPLTSFPRQVPPHRWVVPTTKRDDWAPSLQTHSRPFPAPTSPSAPVPRIGTLALVGLPLELLP